jgi:hypothetical protein
MILPFLLHIVTCTRVLYLYNILQRVSPSSKNKMWDSAEVWLKAVEKATKEACTHPTDDPTDEACLQAIHDILRKSHRVIIPVKGTAYVSNLLHMMQAAANNANTAREYVTFIACLHPCVCETTGTVMLYADDLAACMLVWCALY